MRSLYESLLDGIDVIGKSTDDTIYSAQLQDPNSEFVKSLTSRGGGRLNHYINYYPNRSSYNNSKLYLDVTDYIYDQYNIQKPLSDYFPGVQELEVPGCVVINLDGSRAEFTKDTVAPRIITKGLVVREGRGISDVDINIKSKTNITGSNTISKFIWALDDYASNAKFKNTTITFDKDIVEMNKKLVFSGVVIPDISDLSSNATNICQHDTFMFDPVFEGKPYTKALNNLFDWSYVCTVYDTQKKVFVDRPIKNFKTLYSTANNSKRYMGTQWIYKLNPNAKVSDIYDYKNCPDLHTITIHDNNITLLLTRQSTYMAVHKGWNNKPMTAGQVEALGGTWHDSGMTPMTKDGWWVMIGKTL